MNAAPEFFDTIIVGAGLSGIGAGYSVLHKMKGKSFVILEGRDTIGGTWDLFRYPGIRSDSEMYTLGYSFSPWLDKKMLADGSTILNYIKHTADKYDIRSHIRLNHFVKKVSWSDSTNDWTVTINKTNGSEVAFTMRCNFLFICTGYYDYDKGYTPTFPGSERFKGQIIHPQHWPKDLDYTGKKVIVIGSGATAVTLVPAMAETGAGHITMLQRSPTYIAALPPVDPVAQMLLKILPTSVAHFINRWKNIIGGQFFFWFCRACPNLVKRLIVGQITNYLGKEYERHFTPHYKPWDQRFCVVPDGDLFKAIKDKKASVVTDTIDTFTEAGIKVTGSPDVIPADIIITATGLNLKLCGGMDIIVNGEVKKDMTHNFMYKGVMVSGIPNFILAVGYTNATFTLKVDLISSYFCRLQKHMDKNGFKRCVPVYGIQPGEQEQDVGEDLLNLSSGYIQRAMHILPRQGKQHPWKYYQNYFYDLLAFQYGTLSDGVMQFK